MAGESECRTGSPTMARTRLVAATRLTLAHHSFDRGADQLFQLRVRRSIQLEVSAEWIADLCFRPGSPGVLSQDVGPPFPAQLVYPGAVMPRHGKHHLRLLHHVPGEQA